jgi:hypothetical protein
LHLLEAARLQSLKPCGMRQQPGEVEVQPAFRVRSRRRLPKAPERNPGFGSAPGLHDLGLGDAEVLESSLQAAVVEQGDLNGIVDAERLGEQLAYAAIDGVGVGISSRAQRTSLPSLSLAADSIDENPASGEKPAQSGQHGGSQDNDVSPERRTLGRSGATRLRWAR